MVGGGGWAAATPVAAKIGADNCKVLGKQRRDAAPHQVCLRKAVQQEDRRPGPVGAHEDARLTRLDLGSREVIHHFTFSPSYLSRTSINEKRRFRKAQEAANLLFRSYLGAWAPLPSMQVAPGAHELRNEVGEGICGATCRGSGNRPQQNAEAYE